MTKLRYDRVEYPGALAGMYDNPKKKGRPLRRKSRRAIDVAELRKQAVTYAREHGVPVSETLHRWRVDELFATQSVKRGSESGRKVKTATVTSSTKSQPQSAMAGESKNGSLRRQVSDRNPQLSAPRAAAKKPDAKQLSAPSNREEATAAPMWRPVDVNRFYGDGTSLGSSKGHFLVADPDTVVLRVRGAGKFSYRLDSPSAGNKVYRLDTDERAREETLQFMRGRKRLFGTWRSRTNAGGWSIAFRDV